MYHYRTWEFVILDSLYICECARHEPNAYDLFHEPNGYIPVMSARSAVVSGQRDIGMLVFLAYMSCLYVYLTSSQRNMGTRRPVLSPFQA